MVTRHPDYSAIFVVHQKNSVPLELTGPFLLRLAGLSVQSAADAAGIDRSLMYRAFRGERTPPQALRRLFIEQVGLDPWEQAK